MSATVSQALGWLNARVGYRDNGGGRIWGDLIARGIFPAWYNGMAWCGATQLDLCLNLGIDHTPFRPADVIYCPSVVRVAKAHGLWRPSVQSQPGDWCLMRWDGNMQTDEANHIVMVLKNDPNSAYITVIGGNHGDGITSGARGIFVRTWPRSVVLGTVNRQAAYAKGAPSTPAAKPAPTSGTVLKRGSSGAAVKALQSELVRVFPSYAAGPIKGAGGADGVFGTATAAVVVEFQRRAGLVPDGCVGAQTYKALRAFGCRV